MKTLYLTLLTITLYWKLSAQVQPSSELLNVGLVAPDAASIGKFGNIPVSYSTGIPNITIPIYEIKIGRLTVPISLDYHAGGIKVDEIPSSVGIGWALNCGGIVSRNVFGLPDELPGGYLTTPSTDLLQSDPTSYLSNIFYQNAYMGSAETQPDLFSYNILGQSGQFVLNQDGTVFQIPLTNNKISYTASTTGISGFSITNENGVEFIFNSSETIYQFTNTGKITTSWKLNKIIDLNTSEEIDFTYEGLCTNQSPPEEFLRDDSWSASYIPNCVINGATIQVSPAVTSATFGIEHTAEAFLNTITWRGGKVSFVNQCDRSDRSGEKRLSEIDIYGNISGVYTPVKKVTLGNNNYFFNNSNPEQSWRNPGTNYRMRLDNVNIISLNDGDPAQTYRMNYNSTPMASRETCAQDEWGFYNGQTTNVDLMAPHTFGGYSFGNANRNPSSQFMVACSLQSIQYPTGGKTVFELEPNQYKSTAPSVQTTTESCMSTIGGSGPQASSSTSYFTVPTATSIQNIRYVFSFTPNSNIATFSANLIDQSTGQTIFILTSQGVSNPNGSTSPVSLTQGDTYAITTNVIPIGTIPSDEQIPQYSSLNILWDITANITVGAMGGGLRIRSVVNYDANGKFINEDLYKYGNNESGYGILLTPPYILNINQTNTTYQISCGGIVDIAPIPSTVIHANSVIGPSEISGSPVIYSQVTKYQTSADEVGSNGKTIYNYNTTQDEPFLNSSYFDGPFVMSNTWQNGYLNNEQEYKSTGNNLNAYSLVTQKTYSYNVERPKNKNGLKLQSLYTYAPGSDFMVPLYYYLEFNLLPYTIPTGVMLLDAVTNTTYDDNGNSLITTENYTYGNPSYLNLTQKISTNSKGEMVTENYGYPFDFLPTAGSNPYQKMVNQNMVSPVVQYQKAANNTQLLQRNVNYTDLNDPANTNPVDVPLLEPATVNQQIETNPVDTRVTFNKYDAYGNITEQQKTNDMLQSYIWDYNSVYPVAKVEGAPVDQIAYTSFEADETNGNWNFNPAFIATGNGVTGNEYYYLELGYSFITTKSTLLPSTEYVVSYWSKDTQTPYTVTGTVGVPVKGPTINGWTYYEHTVTGVSSVSVSGGEGIDELRLYPKGALMTTSTYTPLVGMTSQCDASNHITNYEYDGFNRLSLIRDENGNIVKQYCYSYTGQSTNCDGKASIELQSNNTGNSFSILLTNANTGDVYNLSVSTDVTGTLIALGRVPLGFYNVLITSTGTSGEGPQTDFMAINFGSNYYDGIPALSLTNIEITGDTQVSFQY